MLNFSNNFYAGLTVDVRRVTWMFVAPRWCGKLRASIKLRCCWMNWSSRMTLDTLSANVTTPTRAESELMSRPSDRAREKSMISSYSASTLPDRSSTSTTSNIDEQPAYDAHTHHVYHFPTYVVQTAVLCGSTNIFFRRKAAVVLRKV